MTMTSTIKKGAKKGAKLWAAKKGFQWTGSILKMGAVAGAGYFAFKFLKKNSGVIKEKIS